MAISTARYRAGLACAVALVATGTAVAEESQRRTIEEIVVTAEKRESTVQDTSIAITAFSDDFLQDFGIRSQEQLQNYTPSTTIQPFDVTIRGVGRNFRTLGGDPGVSTYVNGVYSEDFGIASTENALYDVDRIEILRGPQGTLYGRNAIGGAINFIDKKPTQDWQGEMRTVLGEFQANEFYGFLSGPIAQDLAAFRITGSKARRDGSSEEQGSGFENQSKGDDQNIAIAFNLTPTDNIDVNMRINDRRFRGGIDGQGAFINEGLFQENRAVRNTSVYAPGLCRLPVGALVAPPANRCSIAGVLPVPPAGAFAFTDPNNPSTTAYGLRVRPGIDAAATHRPSSAFQHSLARINGNGNGRDMDTDIDTSGIGDQTFDQEAALFDISYQINDAMSVKYIWGYNEFDYTFDADADSTSSNNGSFHFDILEEVHTYSHELQFFWDFGDTLSTTTGLYYFKSGRDQRLDFFDPFVQGRYTDPAFYGAALTAPVFAVFGQQKNLYSAPAGAQVLGAWQGDSNGTFFQYDNGNTTDAYAAFTQGEWQINESFSLTLGVRWSKDEKEVEEDRFGYFELGSAAFGLPNLFTTNFLMGNISGLGVPTCALTDQNCTRPLRLQGIPLSFADNAYGDDEWDEVTWRVNLDWTPNDDHLIYISATTGYRSGGYNLGLRNCIAQTAPPLPPIPCVLKPYDAETVLAYEMGSKSEFLDNRLQLNLSFYYYDYENYQDRVNEIDPLTNQSRDAVQNAPSAENMGVEVEAYWLATDNWTIGGNYSYAQTEYTDTYFISNEEDPSIPRSIFGPLNTDVEGNDLNRIPPHKFTLFTNYSWPTDVGRFDVFSTLSWQDRAYYTAFNLDIDQAPDFYRWDARFEWTSSDEKLSVSAYVNNIMDDLGIRNLGAGAESGNWARTVTQTYPRFWALDMTYRFGGG